MRILLLLAVLPVVLGESAEPENQCLVSNLEPCVTSLPLLGQTIAPSFTDSELESYCIEWARVQPCVSVVESACAPDDALVDKEGKEMSEKKKEEDHTVQKTEEEIYAIKNATQMAREYLLGFQFLCDTSNRQDYRDHVRMCLDENFLNLTTAAVACYEAYYAVTWWLNRNDPINQYEFCTPAKDYLSCLKIAASETCGETEATWVWNYQNALWGPHLADIECSTKGGMSSGMMAVIGFCAAGAGWAIILALISFCVKPEKNIKKNESDLKKNASAKDLEIKKSESSNSLEMNSKPDPGQINPVFSPAPERGILKHRGTTSSEVTRI